MPDLLLVRPARNAYLFMPASPALLPARAKGRGGKTRLHDAGSPRYPDNSRDNGLMSPLFRKSP